MDDYDVPADKDPYITGWMMSALTTQAKRTGAVAKWAQAELDQLVAVGYIKPRVWWAVRDTQSGTFAAMNLPSKQAALAKRRELGGTSARFRVEPAHPVAPPEEP